MKDGNRGAGLENYFGAAPKVLTDFIIVVSSNGDNNNQIIRITKLIMIMIKVLFKIFGPLTLESYLAAL